MSQLFDFATEHLVPRDDAKEITGPFWDGLTRVWSSAWSVYAGLPEEVRARLAETPYVPPITIFGLAQSFAKDIFSNREDEGIVICPELQVFGFYVGGGKALCDLTPLGRISRSPTAKAGATARNSTSEKSRYLASTIPLRD